MLGLHWQHLGFDEKGVASEFKSLVVDSVRGLAGHTIDAPSILKGLLLPDSIPHRIAAYYRKHLFGKATLQDLPDKPRFVINAANLQSGALWRFMKPYMRDYRVGEIKHPEVELAVAVGASSAFPPFLSPVTLRKGADRFTPGTGHDLQRSPFVDKVVLADGGVYDNLGLETVFKRYRTVLVSDAGGAFAPQGNPKHNWFCQTYRVLQVMDTQVRSLRKHSLIATYVNGDREGAYWGIRTHIENYELEDTLECPVDKTLRLADTATRLKHLAPLHQERLINWGYAVCDAALRKHVKPSLPAPSGFPYPKAGVG